MKTLNRNETAAICGGVDPLGGGPVDRGNLELQWLLDQLAREQEASLLRELALGYAD